MRSMLAALFVVVPHFVCLSSSQAAVLAPPERKGADVALILVPAPRVPAERYLPLARALQRASSDSLWVGLSASSLDVPSTWLLSFQARRLYREMQRQGMSQAPLFLAAHSRSGEVVYELASGQDGFAGVVLLGAFISRAQRGRGLPVPTVTVGGDLDGVCRVTRLAEAFYHQSEPGPDGRLGLVDFPILVVPGASHRQFASGEATGYIARYDLVPELTEPEAHQHIASAVTAFLRDQTSADDGADQELVELMAASAEILRPHLEAMALEGSYHLQPPCSNRGSRPGQCWQRSPWSEYAQQVMAGLDDVALHVTDEFQVVWGVTPVHLPEIHNACLRGEPCTLQISTVSQAVYGAMDQLDNGVGPVSADEIRVKLMSRQSCAAAAGQGPVDFAESDPMTRCAEINELAWQWALDQASPRARARLAQRGVPLAMGQDLGPYNVGPLWIWMPLSQERMFDDDGYPVEVTRSPAMATSVDFFIASAAGYHYCKLLSPARALEWIYVDSLR